MKKKVIIKKQKNYKLTIKLVILYQKFENFYDKKRAKRLFLFYIFIYPVNN